MAGRTLRSPLTADSPPETHSLRREADSLTAAVSQGERTATATHSASSEAALGHFSTPTRSRSSTPSAVCTLIPLTAACSRARTAGARSGATCERPTRSEGPRRSTWRTAAGAPPQWFRPCPATAEPQMAIELTVHEVGDDARVRRVGGSQAVPVRDGVYRTVRCRADAASCTSGRSSLGSGSASHRTAAPLSGEGSSGRWRWRRHQHRGQTRSTTRWVRARWPGGESRRRREVPARRCVRSR